MGREAGVGRDVGVGLEVGVWRREKEEQRQTAAILTAGVADVVAGHEGTDVDQQVAVQHGQLSTAGQQQGGRGDGLGGGRSCRCDLALLQHCLELLVDHLVCDTAQYLLANPACHIININSTVCLPTPPVTTTTSAAQSPLKPAFYNDRSTK